MWTLLDGVHTIVNIRLSQRRWEPHHATPTPLYFASYVRATWRKQGIAGCPPLKQHDTGIRRSGLTHDQLSSSHRANDGGTAHACMRSPRLSAATICQVCFGFCEHGGVTVTPSPLHPRRLYAALSLRCGLEDTAPAEVGDGSESASPNPLR